MLVQCPSCETTYRVPEELITGPNPTFRCSRCKHVFALEADREASPAAEPLPTSPKPSQQAVEKDQELPFSFPPAEKSEARDEESPEALKQEEHFEFGQPQRPALTKGSEPRQPEFSDLQIDKFFPPREKSLGPSAYGCEPSAPSEEQEKGWTLAPPESQAEASLTPPEDESSSGMDAARAAISEFEENWERSRPPTEEDESALRAMDQERPASTVPYLTLFAVLLLAYSVLTLVHQTQPAVLEGLLNNVPWLGSSVLQNDHLRQGIALRSVRPSFQTILGNREVFVLSGVAYNRNTVSVREVQIEGQLFDAQGKEIERQAVWAGNAITPKIIKDLTAQEISILQKLSPQKRFEISPQKAASFVIVFLRPRGTIKDFSCRVLSAEGAA